MSVFEKDEKVKVEEAFTQVMHWLCARNKPTRARFLLKNGSIKEADAKNDDARAFETELLRAAHHDELIFASVLSEFIEPPHRFNVQYDGDDMYVTLEFGT